MRVTRREREGECRGYKCHNCKHFVFTKGVLRWREAGNSWIVGCKESMYRLTHNLLYPLKIKRCRYYVKGGDTMPKIDFDKDDEQTVRDKIEQLRRERMGTTKRARAKSRSKRVSGGSKKRGPIIERV